MNHDVRGIVATKIASNPDLHGVAIDVLVVVCILLVVGCIFGVVFTLFRKETKTDLSARLSQFDIGDANSTQEAILRQSFSDRVIQPMYGKVGDAVQSRMNPGMRERLAEKISLAGNPGNITPEIVFAQQFIFAGVGAVLGLGISLLLAMGIPDNLLVIIVFGIFGFMAPPVMVDRKAKKRKNEIIDAMPNALDLLTISVEAGLAFDAALARVSDKYDNPLSEEFHRVLEEMKLGRPRLESLEAMATRLDLEEVTNFIGAVNQSEQMGTSLGSTLRIQSEELRRRRTQRAEEAGAKAPVKMLLPMVMCIFPTIFIVLLGPAALRIMALMAG